MHIITNVESEVINELMIEIKNISKTIDLTNVLSNISMEIPDSSFFGIIGESGAGKSTLLKCFNKLIDFDSGEIIIDKVSLNHLSSTELRKLRINMGMIFQHFGLLEHKTVFQNISLPLNLWNHPIDQINLRVNELAKLVGIEMYLNKKPSELSGGQKQRVAIARALASKPKYLLCDECTSALDPQNAVMIMELLDQIRGELGVTIVIVTHDMRIAESYCDHIALLDKGNLLDCDRSEIIVNKFPNIFMDYYSRRKAPCSNQLD